VRLFRICAANFLSCVKSALPISATSALSCAKSRFLAHTSLQFTHQHLKRAIREEKAMSRGFKIGVLAAAVMAVAPAAQAFEAGDFVVRGGAVHVAPDDSSDKINVIGVGNTGTEAAVDSNTQLGLRATYMFTDSLGLGLLAATPFKHNITAKGGALPGMGINDLGETKHLPPTLTLQYYPMASGSALQPYAGVGVNYTTFFDEQTDLDGELKLDDSVGAAVEVGVDYMLNDNFGLNAAVWYADIETEAEVEGVTEKFDVQIDPMVYMVGFSYKF
jgi:outer membrane protein